MRFRPSGSAMAKLNVDTNLIETLASLLERTGLTEIEVAEGEARIRVVRAPRPAVVETVAPAARGGANAAPALVDTRAARPPEVSHPGAIRAPMVGTVYLAPEPSAPPFVTVGGEVREGQTLLIIEAMKVMNPIRAPKSGRVVELLVHNGDPVEYGELLMVIE
jgi:acetyl-CoA carboxylase biotin carboxyl carrier protein